MVEAGIGAHYLKDALAQFRKYKTMADAALAQVAEENFFRALDPESNSIALIVKHVSGNMRSRWSGFRETDGEKPDRNRDTEFEVEPDDTRERILRRWEAGWALLFEAVEPVREADLLAVVKIRGEDHSVLEAIQRQLTHYASHVGQIVFLAKHFAGSGWRSLSIPRGKSREFDVAKSGAPYGPLRPTGGLPMRQVPYDRGFGPSRAHGRRGRATRQPLPRRLRGAGRSRRARAARAEDRDARRHRRRPSARHGGLGERAGVLRPGPDPPPPLRLGGRRALLPRGAAPGSRVRHVLDGPGARRAGRGAARGDGAAIENAQRLAPKATPREQTFIALRAQQIEAQAAEGFEQRDEHDAYRSALDEALATYPDDAELWILRGNAEEPGPWGRGQFGGAASIAFYETALVRSPGHQGAHHYLAHSFENIAHPARAAEHGKVYAAVAPGVAHAQHMLGHVLPRLGRWEEALAQFRKADAIEVAYARELNLRPGDDWHHLHNLQLLGYTYLRLGNVAEAEATFRRAFDTPARQPYRGAPQASLAEYYLLRGRLEDALAVSRALQTSTRTPSARAVGRWSKARRSWPRASPTRPRRRRRARQEAARRHGPRVPGYQARYLEIFVRPYIDQLDTEIALRGDSPAAAEASILAVADALSTNPRFDAWGEGLFRLERFASDARRAGRPRSPPTSRPA